MLSHVCVVWMRSMWAIMASPLIISANLRNMSAMNIETYTNREVIAVDQDPLGKQGTRVYGGDMAGGGNGGWRRATAQACNANDKHQIWKYVVSRVDDYHPSCPLPLPPSLMHVCKYTHAPTYSCAHTFIRSYDGANHKTPPGTLYNNETQLLLDVFNCQNLLALWPWVTDGCDGNKGFYFKFSSDSSHHLEAATSDANNCVQDNGDSEELTLEPCTTALSQEWSMTPEGLVKNGAGRFVVRSHFFVFFFCLSSACQSACLCVFMMMMMLLSDGFWWRFCSCLFLWC
jgi:hypothetical protein